MTGPAVIPRACTHIADAGDQFAPAPIHMVQS